MADESQFSISTEELLADLRRVASDLEEPPSLSQYAERGRYARSTYRRRFGSWNEAKEAAGMETENRGGIPRDRLLADLGRVEASLGHSPTMAEYEARGSYTRTPYLNRFEGWNAALEAAGLEPTRRMDVPRDDLIDDLQRVADEVDGALTEREYNELGTFSISPVIDRFGTWNDAKEAADLPSADGRLVLDDQLLADLRRVADDLGRSPTIDEYDRHGTHAPATVQRRFGGWNDAKREAGLERWHAPDELSDEDLLGDIQRVASAVGTSPSMSQYRTQGSFSMTVVLNRFDTWNEAKDAAGLEPNGPGHSRVSTDDLLADIRGVAEEVDDVPTVAEYAERGTHSPDTVRERFGSWDAGKLAAGVSTPEGATVPEALLVADIEGVVDERDDPPTIREYAEYGTYPLTAVHGQFGSWNDALEAVGVFRPIALQKPTREEALKDIKRVSEVCGRSPSLEEYRTHGLFSASAVQDRFGSWNDAKRAAGLETYTRGRPAVDDEDILADIRRVADGVGRSPSVDQYQEHGSFSVLTVLHHFERWNRAKELAGLETYEPVHEQST